MDYVKILIKYYPGLGWMCGDTYESLIWNNELVEKPTDEELNNLWYKMKIDDMREERNKLLRESDFRVLPDYNKHKESWIIYRQELRDFPSIWNDGIPFPSPPLEESVATEATIEETTTEQTTL